MKRKQNLCFIITVALCGIIMIVLCQPGVLARIRDLQQSVLLSAMEGQSDPANPEDTTNPANPEDPTNPANPEEPSQPANPEDITLEIFDGDSMDVYVSTGKKTFFRFVAPRSGNFVLYSTGDDDTCGYLYASDARTELAWNDDYNGFNFYLEYDFTEGETYFFAVEFYGGWNSGTISVTLEHEHLWDSRVITEATCSAPGEMEDVCLICGRTERYSYYVEHAWDEGEVLQEATCTLQRIVKYTCTVCGEAFYEFGDALGHRWSECELVRAESCEEEGQVRLTCAICGETLTQSIPKKMHTDADGDGVCEACSGTYSIVSSGQCGDNAFWTLDAYGRLVITGEGMIWDSVDHTPFLGLTASEVRSVVIEPGITGIGYWAFGWFSSVTEIVLPPTITTVSLSGCTSLREITIPETATYIYIEDCAIERIHFTGTLEQWHRIHYYDYQYDISPNVDCNAVSPYHFHTPDGGFITKEPSCTEYGTVLYTCTVCGNTDEEALPPRHTDKNADGVCDLCGADVYAVTDTGKCGPSLTYTLYENGLLEICGTGVMYDYMWDSSTWNNSTSVFDHDTRIRRVVIQNGATRIGDYAFCYCTELQEISIPESVTGIGMNAFMYCGSIEEITVPGSVEAIDSYAFEHCSYLKTVHLNSGLQTIGDYAFYDCQKLANIDFPNSLSYIGSDIFLENNLIKSVVLGENTTYVDYDAFRDSIAAIYIYSVDCELCVTSIAPGTVIYGYAGSTAEAYAEENGNPFFLLESREVTGIEIVSLPDRLEQPNGAEPDYTGLTIRAFYADGTNALLTDSFAVYRDRSTVTVLYYGFTAQFEIAFVPVQIFEDEDLYLTLRASDTYGNNFFVKFVPEKNAVYHITNMSSGNYIGFRCTLRLMDETRSETYQSGNAKLTYPLTAGKTYYIRVNTYNSDMIRYLFTVTHEHNWAYTYTVREATCARAGITESVCSLCGAKTRQSFARTVHVDGDGDGLCDLCGGAYAYAVESGVCGDNANWTLYSDGTLDICGSGYVWDQMDHWGFWPTSETPAVTVVAEPEITRIGYLALNTLPMRTLYLSDTVTFFDMDEFYAGNLTDIYYAGSEAQWAEIDFGYMAPSGPDESITVHYNCDPAPCEHKWDAGEQTQAPDCEHFGIVTYTCEVCGEKKAEASVPALGHDYIEHEAKAATCTEPGWNAYRTCSRCDYSDYQEIPPTHTDADNDGFCDFCGTHATHKDANGDDICDQCGSALDPRYCKIGENVYYRIVDGVLWIAGEGAISDEWRNYEYGESPLWSYYYSVIRIGRDITYIPNGEFMRNTEYTEITVEEGNPVYHSENNCLIETASCTLLIGCENSVIPAGGSVKYISGDAFYGSKIQTVDIPQGVERIADYAFSYCNMLSSVTVSASVTEIGNNAFFNCSNLETITVAEENPVYHSQNNCLIETASGTLLLYCKNAVIPADGSVTRIGAGAFGPVAGTEVDITIPAAVESIASGAFSYGYYMNITLRVLNRDAEIEENAIPAQAVIYGYEGSTAEAYALSHGNTFIVIHEHIWDEGEVTVSPTCEENGTKLYTCTECGETYTEELPALGHDYIEHEAKAATCTEIGWNAYRTCSRCDYSDYLEIPPAHTDADSDGICDICGVEMIVSSGKCGPDLTYTLYENGLLVISGTGDMYNYEDGLDVFSSAPWGKDIKSVTIQHGATSIGTDAFYGCKQLTSIVIPESITSIGARAFFECSSLTAIEIPENVTSIGGCAFEDCGNLVSVELPQGLTQINERTFSGCSGLTSITIPDGVTSIGEYAFRSCINLQSITIPDSVTDIGMFAFAACISLTSVRIPDTVSTLSASVFLGCQNLEEVFLPESLSTVEVLAFFGCPNLKDVYYPGSEKDWNKVTIKSFNGDLLNANIHYMKCEHVWNEGSVTVSADCENSGIKTYTCTVCGETYTEEIPALGHDYVDHGGQAATCLADGWKPYQTCSRCDYTSYEKIDALGHDYGEWTQTTNPTCTEAGVETRYCSRCDATETRPVEERGHDYIGVVTEPTCTEDGYTTYTCSRCGDSYTADETDALGHDYVDHDGQSATCLDDGWKPYQTCSRCDYTSYEKIDALGHDYVDHDGQAATCLAEGWKPYQTCTRCDYTSYEKIDALGHDLIPHEAKEATCTDVGWKAYDTCSRCDYTTYVEIPALTHNWGEWENNTATCIAGGTEMRECSRCHETESRNTAALGHDYADHEGQAATCLADGWKPYQTCTRCDYTSYEKIDALGHDYADHEGQAATCLADGWKPYQTCTRCDYTSYEKINALGHDYVDHGGQTATCTEIGWKAYKTCSRCDYTTCEEISALGHDYVEHTAKAATCTEIGWDTYQTCSRCDYTTYKEIAALGHNYVNHDGQAATCIAEGWKPYQTCTRCDYTSYEEIAVLGHDYVDHDAKAATCTGIGWKAYKTCSRCDYTSYEELPALGHDYGDWLQTQAPSCTEKGEEKRTCSRCDAAETRTVDALTHRFTVLRSDAASHWYECANGCGICTEKEPHSFGAWITDVEATAEREGTAHRICADCQYTETKTLPKEIETYLFGDVDRDGLITAADARSALRKAVGLELYEAGSYEFFMCDVDFDGTVTAADARLILRAAVNLEDPNTWLEKYRAMAGETMRELSLSVGDADRSAGIEPADDPLALRISPALPQDGAQTMDEVYKPATDVNADCEVRKH